MRNEATESVSDMEAVQRVMERLLKTQTEFREAEMRMKIKDCQGVRVKSNQHRGQYLEGDKVWYQHENSKAWLVPADVFHHKGNSVWLYISGNMLKVAICRIKPYELIQREGE